MSEAGGKAPMQQAEMNAILGAYAQTTGQVSPRVRSRVERAAAADPELLRRVEALREHVVLQGPFDTRTTHLMLFGMLLAIGDESARVHALAARRAGASWEELHGAAGLAAVCRGLASFDAAGEAWEYVALQETTGGAMAITARPPAGTSTVARNGNPPGHAGRPNTGGPRGG